MNKYWRHLKTITKHKWYVFVACAHVGLVWRGIIHDLSKYSPIEFFSSARYFQGNKSPTEVEKAKSSYSIAWMNHKAKNKHHWQYWLDNEGDQIFPIEMPVKYIKEMLCDWLGAGKAYNKDSWTIDDLKTWWAVNKTNIMITNKTYHIIEFCLQAKDENALYIAMKLLKSVK